MITNDLKQLKMTEVSKNGSAMPIKATNTVWNTGKAQTVEDKKKISQGIQDRILLARINSY